jgi:type I restriction enzyme, S subunit
LAFIADGKFWVNNHAHILKAKNDQNKYFALQIELNDFTTKASGSAQPKLTKEAIGDLELIVPPISEQQEIVAYLDNQTSLIDQNISLEVQKIEKLKEYRQSLISNVVTGKVCVLAEA